jgi:tRNA-binding EMAP/Myf-like protein
MMGIESQGMILTVEDADGKLRLLGPYGEASPGAVIG